MFKWWSLIPLSHSCGSTRCSLQLKRFKVIAHHLCSTTNRKLQLQQRFASQTRAGVQAIGRRLTPAHTGLWPCGQPATRRPVLPFNGLHPRNPCNYSFTDPDGMEEWVGLVGWPIADTLPTKWSHVNHRSGVVGGRLRLSCGRSRKVYVLMAVCTVPARSFLPGHAGCRTAGNRKLEPYKCKRGITRARNHDNKITTTKIMPIYYVDNRNAMRLLELLCDGLVFCVCNKFVYIFPATISFWWVAVVRTVFRTSDFAAERTVWRHITDQLIDYCLHVLQMTRIGP